MSNCPGTDALTTIAGALDWNVDEGVRHLASCDDCMGQLRDLRGVRDAYDVEEDVPSEVLARIGGGIAHLRAREVSQGKRNRSFGEALEAVLAGATAMVVLNAGGLTVPAALNAAVFAVVATSLFGYRAFSSSHSTASRSS